MPCRGLVSARSIGEKKSSPPCGAGEVVPPPQLTLWLGRVRIVSLSLVLTPLGHTVPPLTTICAVDPFDNNAFFEG